VNELRRKIVREIHARGPIPFSRYMEMCLYDPEHGYYSRNAAQFGKAGDFYTSSDVHAVFGRLLARQFDEIWRVLGSPTSIVLKELGPGRGLFAQDVLDWSEKKFPNFFRALHYVLAERSPALRERIQQTLSRHLESGKTIFTDAPSWTESPQNCTTSAEPKETLAPREIGGGATAEPKETLVLRIIGKGTTSVVPITGQTGSALAAEVPTIIFANEFFDALPVEIVSPKGSLRIDSRDGRFIETWVPSSAAELEFLDRYSIHPEIHPENRLRNNERIEIPFAAHSCAEEVLRDIAQGFFLAIDYGYTRQEQLAGRHRGTLKAIRQHSVSANPYEAPGEQDITADVNFTALAAIAEKQGWSAQKLITQSQFLMGIGEANQFADAFEDCRLPQERAKVALQLKHLVTPAGMGESFHVLLASKGIEAEKVSELAGLNFGRR
jgi:SAM-dependent MidA family methyltransferase